MTFTTTEARVAHQQNLVKWRGEKARQRKIAKFHAENDEISHVIDGEFFCKCGASHSRGVISLAPDNDGSYRTYRCLKCGENSLVYPSRILDTQRVRNKTLEFVRNYSHPDFSPVEMKLAEELIGDPIKTTLIESATQLADFFERDHKLRQEGHDRFCDSTKPDACFDFEGRHYHGYVHDTNVFYTYQLPNGSWKYPFELTVPVKFITALVSR